MFNKSIKRGRRKVVKNDVDFCLLPVRPSDTVFILRHASRSAAPPNFPQQPQKAAVAAPERQPPGTIENLPMLRDVAVVERQELFLRKLKICCLQFDFSDILKMAKEKEIKRQTLIELADFIQSDYGTISELNQAEMIKMVSVNIFRCLPPAPYETTGCENIESGEDDPLLNPAWPHLQLVYELLLRYVVSSDTETKIAKRYIDHCFVLKLLDLFDSEDPREREYLKTILHRIYGKFTVHRPFIRKTINNMFYRFIYETGRHNGIAELLEILGSIINGFALPIKEEHELFLERALIPLHKSKALAMYHSQLTYCIIQFVEKDPKLADTVIMGLLKYWPVTNSQKEVLFLVELEEVLEGTNMVEFQRCMVPLFRQIARSINSSQFQVAERALSLWNNEHIVDLITQNRNVILPIIYEALEKNKQFHWNQAVHSLSRNVRRMVLGMDEELFKEWQRQYEERKAGWKEVEERRELIWQGLAAAGEGFLHSLGFISPRPKVSPEMNNSLMKPYIEGDIIEALKQMQPLKAPGPDGIPALFISKFWSIIKHDLVPTIVNILNHGFSPQSINHTNIVLIPKTNSPATPQDYRPISLCNVVIKLVTKCIANRLKTTLPDVINQAQSAFIPGRLITDNSLLAAEFFHTLKSNKSKNQSSFALKLDLSKPYDRVDWAFLKNVLLRFGLHQQVINLIMRCVTSVSYSILINGNHSPSFSPSRGLRQGDPLSPYLFLFCTEAFSALIQQAETNGLIHGAKICRNAPTITHLFFADDSIIFGRACEREILTMKSIVEVFTRSSGQRVNFEKSAVAFSKCLLLERVSYLGSLLGTPVVEKHVSYLGMPVSVGQRKRDIFDFLVDRVHKKLKNWKIRSLSRAGKLTLIKAVAQAIPSYIMSCCLLPLSVIQKINQAIANFLWGQKNSERRIHWCSWENQCARKEFGGLGFRELECFNKAFLAKQGWRLTTHPNSLLARCLKARYYPRGNLLDAKIGHNPSFSWRSILSGVPILKEGIEWTVRDGRSISVWKDHWIRGFFPLIPSSPNSFFLQEINVVRDLMCDDGQDWDHELLHSIFPPEVRQAIAAIPISSHLAEDCLNWRHTKNGCFTVKSGYWVAKSMKDASSSKASSSTNNPDFWRWIWRLNLPPKMQIFAWRCLRGILPTNINLQKRGTPIDPICCRCGEDVETKEHTLRDCSWSKFLWMTYTLRIQSNTTGNHFAIQDWIIDTIKDKPPEYVECFIALLWTLWKSRNLLCFQQRMLSVHDCFAMALSSRMQYQFANDVVHSTTAGKSTPSPWMPPHVDWVKINSDASLDPSGAGGLACTFSNIRGAPLKISSKFLQKCEDIDVGETLACLEGLVAAKQEGFRSVCVEMDNQGVILKLQNKDIPRTSLGTIILDILFIAQTFEEVCFLWVPRTQNLLAHKLANLVCIHKRAFVPSPPYDVALQRILSAYAEFI